MKQTWDQTVFNEEEAPSKSLEVAEVYGTRKVQTPYDSLTPPSSAYMNGSHKCRGTLIWHPCQHTGQLVRRWLVIAN
ncbi:unnamed protein product [Enterobius vermicularis]|uniref:Autophagy_act_C domain-containing protein n=1 Tax=Enterobius vermicularis TaxID=51028 RepID=A0A0N4VGN4_ENTVE|nr:unnamed protein product [Enterobius vermicularis]